jgi:uncharacterized protein YxjI
MREKLFAIGDDFWIENADGERMFKVDGKALRVRQTLALECAGSGRRTAPSRSACASTRWAASAS